MVAPQRSVLALVVAVATASTFLGCSSDADTAREIQSQRHRQVQAQSEQDHLGDGFSLLQRLVDLNPETAKRQIAYHLNRWLEDRPSQSGTENPSQTTEQSEAAPTLLRTVSDLLPIEKSADRVGRGRFVASDVNHLRDCYLFRQIVLWVDQRRSDDPLLVDWLIAEEQTLGAGQADKIRTASRLFDWTVRNIALEPPRPPSEDAPAMPLGMEFEPTG